jgi:TetR/AcrR family transcriptional regulator, acrAB operon repressor
MGRQAEISAESRSRLMAAAWELLAEGGPKATTVQAVAERAGISRGSISWHFGSKDGLIVAVVNNAIDVVCASINQVFDTTEPPGWQAVLDAQAIMLTDDRFKIFGSLMLEATTEKGPVTDAFTDGQARVRDLYASYIAEHGLVSGDVDPADAATAVRALTLGLNIQSRFDGGVIPLQQAFEALQAVTPTTRTRPARKTSPRR